MEPMIILGLWFRVSSLFESGVLGSGLGGGFVRVIVLRPK